MRNVGANRKNNAGKALRGFLVVLRDFLANLSSRGAHNGIGVGIVIGLAIEKSHAQGAFFEGCQIAFERLPNDKVEKLAAAPRSSKVVGFEQVCQFGKHAVAIFHRE